MVTAEYIIYRFEMRGRGRREDGDWRQEMNGMQQECIL
jgi:hypothetical protein